MLNTNLKTDQLLKEILEKCDTTEEWTTEELFFCSKKLQLNFRIHPRTSGNHYFYAAFKLGRPLEKATATGPNFQDLIRTVMREVSIKLTDHITYSLRRDNVAK